MAGQSMDTEMRGMASVDSASGKQAGTSREGAAAGAPAGEAQAGASHDGEAQAGASHDGASPAGPAGVSQTGMSQGGVSAAGPADAGWLSWRTEGVEKTIALGAALGRVLRPGDVLVLTGDLGAGKTQLTKGIAAGMGIDDDVCSPTFNILMVYEGIEMPLYHFDLYRLDDASELEDTGIYDLLGGDGPCVIEWGEQFAEELGDERLDVYVSRLEREAAPGGEPPRELRLVPHGARARELAHAFADGLL